MEQNPGLLDPDDRKAALESFLFFEKRAAWSSEQSKRLAEEAERHYLDAKARYEADVKEQNQYARLVKLYSDPDTLPRIGDSQNSVEEHANQDLGVVVEEKVEGVIEPKKRNSYLESPKQKLKELLFTAHYFKTDQQLKERLEFELKVVDIPMKTVQNRLFDLDREGIIKRIKHKELGFISGKPDWFDGDGNPLSAYFKQ